MAKRSAQERSETPLFGELVEEAIDVMRTLSIDGEVRYNGGRGARHFSFRQRDGQLVKVPFLVAAKGAEAAKAHIDAHAPALDPHRTPAQEVDLLFKPHPELSSTIPFSSVRKAHLHEKVVAHVKERSAGGTRSVPPGVFDAYRMEFALLSIHPIDGVLHAIWLVHYSDAPEPSARKRR
jgi:hypothetical protein